MQVVLSIERNGILAVVFSNRVVPASEVLKVLARDGRKAVRRDRRRRTGGGIVRSGSGRGARGLPLAEYGSTSELRGTRASLGGGPSTQEEVVEPSRAWRGEDERQSRLLVRSDA